MLSYHNDPEIKARYITRFEAHRAADEVIQGMGFEHGQGCFVGCTLDNYDHSRFPIELGWPEWLAYLSDVIFEGLSKSEAPQFGSDLLAAVPVGVDLDPVQHTIAINRMDRLLEMTEVTSNKKIKAAVKSVRNCHEAVLVGKNCNWQSAEAEAEAAARTSRLSAAKRAVAWSAVESTRVGPWSAADSARTAAQVVPGADAEQAAWKKERDVLLDALHGLSQRSFNV